MLFWLIGDLSGAAHGESRAGGAWRRALARVGPSRATPRCLRAATRPPRAWASPCARVTLALHLLAAFATAIAVTVARQRRLRRPRRAARGAPRHRQRPALAAARGRARRRRAARCSPTRSRARSSRRRSCRSACSRRSPACRSSCGCCGAPRDECLAPVLSCRGVTLAVPGRTLCRGVSFDVRAGRVLGHRRPQRRRQDDAAAHAGGTAAAAAGGTSRSRARPLGEPLAARSARSAWACCRRTPSTPFRPPRSRSRSADGTRTSRAGVRKVRQMCDIAPRCAGRGRHERRCARATCRRSPAASAAASRWRCCSRRTRRSCCSTSRPITWTSRTRCACLELLARLARERGRAVVMALHDFALAARYATHAVLFGCDAVECGAGGRAPERRASVRAVRPAAGRRRPPARHRVSSRLAAIDARRGSRARRPAPRKARPRRRRSAGPADAGGRRRRTNRLPSAHRGQRMPALPVVEPRAAACRRRCRRRSRPAARPAPPRTRPTAPAASARRRRSSPPHSAIASEMRWLPPIVYSGSFHTS